MRTEEIRGNFIAIFALLVFLFILSAITIVCVLNIFNGEYLVYIQEEVCHNGTGPYSEFTIRASDGYSNGGTNYHSFEIIDFSLDEEAINKAFQILGNITASVTIPEFYPELIGQITPSIFYNDNLFHTTTIRAYKNAPYKKCGMEFVPVKVIKK